MTEQIQCSAPYKCCRYCAIFCPNSLPWSYLLSCRYFHYFCCATICLMKSSPLWIHGNHWLKEKYRLACFVPLAVAFLASSFFVRTPFCFFERPFSFGKGMLMDSLISSGVLDPLHQQCSAKDYRRQPGYPLFMQFPLLCFLLNADDRMRYCLLNKKMLGLCYEVK